MWELYEECHKLFSYDAITGVFTRKVRTSNRVKIGDVVEGFDKDGYLRVQIQGRKYKLHRIIWLMMSGVLPKDNIDHVNGIKDDNRWCNLREATPSENQHNRGKYKNNTTGFKGVVRTNRLDKPFRAKISCNGKMKHLGEFNTPELAHQAYSEAAKQLHGKFARAE